MLTLYMDYMSQPSRFVVIAFNILKVPHEIKEISLMKMEQRSKDYARINRYRKVPAIVDGDFQLAESHTIVRYVIQSRKIQTSLYPINDHQIQARIDEYLDYHHTNTRKCATLLFNLLIAPALGAETVNVDILRKEVESFLGFMNKHLLKDTQYLVAQRLTLADLAAYCEIICLKQIDFDLTPYPNVQNWLNLIGSLPEVKLANEKANL